MIEKLDRWWEQFRQGKPRFEAADRTDDQTHVNHTLVVISGFGSLGMCFGLIELLLGGSLTGLFVAPLACGILGGLLFYFFREIGSRLAYGRWWVRFDWRYKPWDGTNDVLVPAAWTLPWALAALYGVVPWWSGLLLWLAGLAVTAMNFFLRPLHAETEPAVH